MNTFDKVIGYDSIKNELYQIIDMIKMKDVYTSLGAKMPRGILLYGAPGLGKSLIANCFIEESKLKSFTIRRNRGNDDFIGLITETFKQAKENAPSIVFLDDMDKFANEDSDHADTEEYVAVQSGIDEVKNEDVFVLATCNDIDKLPESLIRAGRFDRKLEVQIPTEQDALEIIKHYLKDKKISNINMEDLSKMISYSSCAELETILNEAAINAGFNRKEKVDMQDIICAVLKKQYNSPDDFEKVSEEDKRRTSIHEAGHLVVSEILNEGSVGLVSIRSAGRDNKRGFIHRCKEEDKWYYNAIIGLAGKAAVELYYPGEYANGCASDLEKVYLTVKENIAQNGMNGFSHYYTRNRVWLYGEPPEELLYKNEMAIQSEMEKYYLKAKDIISKNIKFLEEVVESLIVKETLLYSDIKKIKQKIKLIKETV